MSKLNYHQSFLFNPSALLPRPIPEQERFVAENKSFLCQFIELINQAFIITYQRSKEKTPLSMNRLWFANEMNGNLLSLTAKEFPYYVKSTGRGSYALLLDYKYECYIKKLNSKTLRPEYNHSISSKALMNQEAKKNEQQIPVIYVGWTHNKYKDALTGYYAVCFEGNTRLWATDLRTVAAAKSNNQEETKQEGAVIVKIRDKKKAN